MDQLDEIRAKIDIVQLISEYFPLKKSGRNFKALCPFHTEKTPSFIVSPERQIFKCFGCGEGGDVFGFLMKMEGMEFGEALRTLAKRVGVKLVSYKPGPKEEEKERIYILNHLASEFYHYFLVFHPLGQRARDYILSRGIKKESVQLFKLGYAPAVSFALQKFLVEKKGYKIEDLLKAGLVVRAGGGYRDFFRDRLVFPLRDHRGNFVGFSGRVIGEWREEEAQRIGPKYINTPETLVYQKGSLLYGLEISKNQIKTKDQVVIVEGEFDMISSFQVGLENVVAIKGSALTEAQVSLLKRLCGNIVLALDMDIAGDKATRRGIEIADSSGLDIRVARISGKDPDELAGKNPELLKKAIGEAIPVYDFFMESAFSRFDAATPEGKKRIGEDLLPIFARISDEIVKSYYLRKLAEKLEVPEEAVLAQLVKEKREAGAVSGMMGLGKSSARPRREILEEYLFSLVFQKGEPDLLLAPEIEKIIKTPSLARILRILKDFLKDKGAKFESALFAQKIPGELLEIFNGFYLRDLGKKVLSEEWAKAEFSRTVSEIRKAEIKERLKELSRQMAICERENQTGKLKQLEEEFKKISQEARDII